MQSQVDTIMHQKSLHTHGTASWQHVSFITRCTNNLLPLPNITIICQASTAQILRNIWYTSLSLCSLSSQHKFYIEIFLSSRSFFITHRAAVAKACNSSKVAAGPVKVVVPGGACGWNIGENLLLYIWVCKVGDFYVKHINNNIMIYVEQNSMVPSSNPNADAHDLSFLLRMNYIINEMWCILQMNESMNHLKESK